MTTDKRKTDLIARYLDDLALNPHAAPPPGLDADDVALARALVRAHKTPSLDQLQRALLWRRITAQAADRQHRHEDDPVHDPNDDRLRLDLPRSSNGHKPQETMPMLVQTRTQTLKQRPIQWDHWVAAAAVITVLILVGLMVFRAATSLPPGDGSQGNGNVPAGQNQDQQNAQRDPTATFIAPSGTPVPTSSSLPPTTIAPENGLTPTLVPGMYEAPQGGPTVVSPLGQGMNAEALQLVLDLPGVALRDVTWSPDGRWVVVQDGTDTALYNVVGGRLLQDPAFAPAQDGVAVTSMVFSLDSMLLVIGFDNGHFAIWSLQTHGQLADYEASSGSEEAPVVALAFSPDGRTLMVETEDAVTFWTTP